MTHLNEDFDFADFDKVASRTPSGNFLSSIMPSKKKKQVSSATPDASEVSRPISDAGDTLHADIVNSHSDTADSKVSELPAATVPDSSARLPNVVTAASGTPQGLTMRQRLQALKASMQDQGVNISEPDRGGIGCTFEQISGEEGPMFVVVRLLRGGSAFVSGAVAEGDIIVSCNGRAIDNMLDLRDLVHGTVGDSITCIFRSRLQDREYEVVLGLLPEPFDHISITTGSDHAQISPQKKHYAHPESSGDEHLDALMQKLIHAEGLVMESDALYAGVQQSLVSTIHGDSVPFQERIPVYYNTEDGRNWKHEYEMLSLVLARYQDLMDAHAASSQSGESTRIVEERRVFEKQISELRQSVEFLTEQFASTKSQLDAKEQQMVKLHAALRQANDSRSQTDATCRALQLSVASTQGLLEAARSENNELAREVELTKARLKDQQQRFCDQLKEQQQQSTLQLPMASHSEIRASEPARPQPDTRIDIASLEAKLRALTAGVECRDVTSSTGVAAPRAPSFPPRNDSISASFDKGTLLATMLLEQAREGRINVDAVHLQALKMSLDGASSSAPDVATVLAMRDEEVTVQLLNFQRRLDQTIADSQRKELQWHVAEAQFQQERSSLLNDLAAARDAHASVEARMFELVTEFTERDMKSAHDAEVRIQSVKRSCESRIEQLEVESSAAVKRAEEAAASAIAAVRDESAIQLQSVTEACRALELRCSTLHSHLLAEQNATKSLQADHDRTLASMRMENDRVSAALVAARSDISNFISDAAVLKIEIRNQEQAMQDMQTDFLKLKDAAEHAIQEKLAAEKTVQFLQEQLLQASASVAKLDDEMKIEKEAAKSLRDVSFKMAGLEVRVQQLAQELESSVSELAHSRASGAACCQELDKVSHELLTIKEDSAEQRSRYENEIQHLKGHLRETAAAKVAAEDQIMILNKEIIGLKQNIDSMNTQLTQQQKDAVAGAEETRDLHLKALQFIKEQHNHQSQQLAEQHAQQKQLWLHTEQELRDKLLERKQAALAALAAIDIQKKAAEADAAALRHENSLQLEQVLSMFRIHRSSVAMS